MIRLVPVNDGPKGMGCEYLLVGGAQVPVPAGEQLPGPVDLPVRSHLSVFHTGLYCTIKCLLVFLHLEVNKLQVNFWLVALRKLYLIVNLPG